MFFSKISEVDLLQLPSLAYWVFGGGGDVTEATMLDPEKLF